MNELHQIKKAIFVWGIALLCASPVHAQNRGAYPLGMSSTNSGITPKSGFTYSNQLLFYSRDKAKDNNGATIPVKGHNSVLLDMNTFTWVSQNLGGFKYSAAASLPFARNSLTSDTSSESTGGSGFGDSYYMPTILSWTRERSAIRAIFGFLAPTGKFNAGATDNVGSGYWTMAFSSGQTYFLTENKRLTLSLFEMYEIHTVQESTAIKPGDTFNLDYSLMGSFSQIQFGLTGYLQRQVTAKTGPQITSAASDDRYAVNALGFAVVGMFEEIKTNISLKYFKEFSNRSTFQGHSLQVAGAISF